MRTAVPQLLGEAWVLRAVYARRRDAGSVPGNAARLGMRRLGMRLKPHPTHPLRPFQALRIQGTHNLRAACARPNDGRQARTKGRIPNATRSSLLKNGFPGSIEVARIEGGTVQPRPQGSEPHPQCPSGHHSGHPPLTPSPETPKIKPSRSPALEVGSPSAPQEARFPCLFCFSDCPLSWLQVGRWLNGKDTFPRHWK